MTYFNKESRERLAAFNARLKRNPFSDGQFKPPPETLALWDRLRELGTRARQLFTTPFSEMNEGQPSPAEKTAEFIGGIPERWEKTREYVQNIPALAPLKRAAEWAETPVNIPGQPPMSPADILETGLMYGTMEGGSIKALGGMGKLAGKAAEEAGAVGKGAGKAPKGKLPIPETGMPEVGLQPSMLGEAPIEVRPAGKGVLKQTEMDDFMKLRKAQEAGGVAPETGKVFTPKEQAVKEAEQALHEATAEASVLKETVDLDPLKRLMPMWKRMQKRKDANPAVTLKEYREFTGKQSPPQTSLTPDGKHVAWRDALDSVADEYGYEDTESLLEGLNRLGGEYDKLNKLQGQSASLSNNLENLKKSVPTGEVTKVTPKEPWMMTREELESVYKTKSVEEKTGDLSVFGSQEKLDRYNRASRMAESTDPKRATEGSRIVSEMEGALTESQQNKLFGVGEKYVADDYKELLDAAGNLDFTSPQSLGDSLKWAITKVGKETNPNLMNSQELKAFYQLKIGYEEATRLGWDLKTIEKSMIKGAAARFGDVEDAAYMLQRFKKGKLALPESVKPSGVTPEIPKAETPKVEAPALNIEREGQASMPKTALSGGEPPKVPPEGKVTPFGEPLKPEGTPPVYQKRREIIAQSAEMVRQDRPGAISRLLQKIPGVKQAREFERPAFKMTGENEKLLVGHVAETAARSDVATRQFTTRLPLLKQIESTFGKEALHGGKTTVPFVGTVEQAKNPITGTIKDIVDNPELYQLDDAQKALLANMETRNAESLRYVTEGYGAEIGQFKPKPGGAYLPNVDIADDVVEFLGSESRTVATGRGKTRIWQTARDRMASDKTFVPETDVRKMLEGTDTFKASAAAGNTFREAVGGMTRLEAIEKTHPNLYKKMMALRGRLQSLKGSAGTLDENLVKGVDKFLNSSGEVTDIIDLSDSLTLKRGIRQGMGKSDIQKEIDGIQLQIKALKPAWEAANLKPYTLVQEGIYRYFPMEQAKLITELRKTTNNALLNTMDNIRATAFSGDLSPILGVQTPIGVLADPLGSFMAGKGGIAKMAGETGLKNKLLRPFKLEALSEDVAADPDKWAKFFSLMGRAPVGTPKEFAAGFLGKIKGFNAATEATYTFVTRQQFALWDRTTQQLIKSGLPGLEAQVAAASKAAEIYPLVSPSRLGQSQARASLLRALPTSYSFIRQPANMIAEASRGFVKLGLKKTLTPREKVSVRLMTTMAASVLSTAAISQVATAAAKGEDVKKAFIDAVNPDPYNGNFASLVVGNYRVPIGGPYRAIFRAIFPQEVKGIPFPVPFAGVMRYLQNRVNPLASTQIDLVRNKDYYGKQILKGDFPEQLLRGIAYEVEGVLPLTLGSGVEGVRTGEETDKVLEQMAGQFAGVSLAPAKPDVERINKAMGKVLPKLGQPDTETLNKKLEKALTPERKAEITKQGSIFNIGDLGEAIDSATYNKKLADMPEGRYPPIVYARKQADEAFEKFYNSIPTEDRDGYRAEKPTLDAQLFFWGRVEAVKTVEAMTIVRRMMSQYGIPESAIPGLSKKTPTGTQGLKGFSGQKSRFTVPPRAKSRFTVPAR